MIARFVLRRGQVPERAARLLTYGLDQDFSLYSRIEGATKLMVFTEEESTRAHQIRKDGNELLHPPDPEQFDRVRRELNARAMVGSLAVLLRKLFPEAGA